MKVLRSLVKPRNLRGTRFAEFDVPAKIAGGLDGAWFWRLAAWPGVKAVKLSSYFDPGTLEVTATKKAMRRVRCYCTKHGYRERTNA